MLPIGFVYDFLSKLTDKSRVINASDIHRYNAMTITFMSSKKKIGIVIVVAVLAITFMTVAFLTTQTNTDYYTQIDNRWVTDIAPHGAMNYKYTLVAYDESGNVKDVTFETSKVLTDGAYLCLKVAPIRGVVTWAEMQFDELPSSVQEKYKE